MRSGVILWLMDDGGVLGLTTTLVPLGERLSISSLGMEAFSYQLCNCHRLFIGRYLKAFIRFLSSGCHQASWGFSFVLSLTTTAHPANAFICLEL